MDRMTVCLKIMAVGILFSGGMGTLAQDAQDAESRRAEFMNRIGGMPGMGGRAGDAAPQAAATSEATRNAAIASQRTAGDTSASDVAINWENITLKDCIEVLCRDLEMEFIISPSVNVAQEVSIRAGDVTAWKREDKLEMFDAILETAGVQRIARGRVWVFSPSDIRPIVKDAEDAGFSDGKPIIGAIELENIDAAAAESFLNNFSGKPQRIFGMTGSRILIVMGTQAYLKQMQDLLSIVDVPSSVLVQHVLKTADATDVAEELSAIFFKRTGSNGAAVQFFPIARLNMVVAHNVAPVMVPEIERWIGMLDRSDSLNERVTKIYRLKVIEAKTIGDTLDELYSSLYAQSLDREKELGKTSAKNAKNAENKEAKKTEKTNAVKTQNQNGAQPAAAAVAPAATASSSSSDSSLASGGTVSEEVIILADEDTNTLIVNAPADMQKEIAKTIEDLDRSRRQVLIETVLVEVILDESLDLGIEWAVLDSANPSHSGALKSGLDLQSLTTGGNPITTAEPGLSYLFNKSDEQLALIRAAQNDDRLQVLSSPTVLTRDGMEAEISFGEEVPIQQSSLTDGGNQNFSYDYRDAKITLTVTPHIDDNRMVTLDLQQTLRSINPDTENDEAPKFYTRELRSNLQVDDGQTLVLGGLIQRKDQKIQQGIPYLCKIPYIGWMFGRTQTIKVGAEILMILTPHVVDTRDETDQLSRDFQYKVLGSMSEKDIRSLYNLRDEAPAAETRQGSE